MSAAILVQTMEGYPSEDEALDAAAGKARRKSGGRVLGRGDLTLDGRRRRSPSVSFFSTGQVGRILSDVAATPNLSLN